MKSIITIVLTTILVSSAIGYSVNSTDAPQENEYQENISEVVEENGVSEMLEEQVDMEPEDNSITMTFVGDCMLASYKNEFKSGGWRDYLNNNDPSYFLEKVKPIFERDDFTVVNLENVLTDRVLSPKKKDHSPAYWYYGPTSNMDILTSSSVEGASLANNHANDYGPQGFADTVGAVENSGIEYGHNDKTMYFEKNGFKIAVICHGLWNEWQADTIVNKIKKESEKTDFQIVFYHGGTERKHYPDVWRVKAEKKLVDAGADLVIGNHPHVLQPMETYNGVEIVHSMGNFLFGGSLKPENRTIIYQFKITPNDNGWDFKSEIIPCYVYGGSVNNYQPYPIPEDDENYQKVIDFMAGKIDSPV